MLRAWLRRGSIKKKSKNIPVESIGKFHVVIRPGDSGVQNFDGEMNHSIPIVKTNPILIHDSNSQSNEDIRGRLGVPEYATLCYLQLGAGKINDIDSEISMTLDALDEFDHVYTIVGESMLGERISHSSEKVRILRDYPNSKFFHQFDFSVIAGGYNSYHEVIEAGLPSICYPNLATGRDDQLARVSIASEAGAMIVLEDRNPISISLAISRMMDPVVRDLMRSRMAPMRKPNGATEASLWLFDQLAS
jgi:UDP:flavonoid glycosyltransferase YjiC (YdhE family)